jgi:hypothetical protein
VHAPVKGIQPSSTVKGSGPTTPTFVSSSLLTQKRFGAGARRYELDVLAPRINQEVRPENGP